MPFLICLMLCLGWEVEAVGVLFGTGQGCGCANFREVHFQLANSGLDSKTQP